MSPRVSARRISVSLGCATRIYIYIARLRFIVACVLLYTRIPLTSVNFAGRYRVAEPRNNRISIYSYYRLPCASTRLTLRGPLVARDTRARLSCTSRNKSYRYIYKRCVSASLFIFFLTLSSGIFISNRRDVFYLSGR